MTETHDPFIVELPAGVAHFFGVYTPWRFGPDMPPRYGLSFPAGYVSDHSDLDGIRLMAPKADMVFTEPYVSCSSGARPEVEVLGLGFVDDLVQELQRLDARNVSRDQLFKDLALRLTLQAFDYNTPQRKGTGLALRKVGVYLS